MTTFADALTVLASVEETFVDKDLLYVAGGVLVLLALGFSFMGMRSESFPTSTQLKAIIGITAVVVVVTGFGALQTARFEQAERRLENEEAAQETEEETIENEESLEEGTEGPAADPDSGTGATPDSGTDASPSGETEEAPEDTSEDPETDTLSPSEQGSVPSASSQSASADEDLEIGQTIFTDTGCGGCHTLADAGANGNVGPNLDDAIPEMSTEEVRTAIVDPGAEVAEGFPDGTMPSNYGQELDETQLDTLVNYLVTVTKG